MCGIFGTIAGPDSVLCDMDRFYKAGDILSHRGPDGEGYLSFDKTLRGNAVNIWHNRSVEEIRSPIVMGHRRLSIIDLSERGLQPMSDHSKRIVIVFNGEIYNYIELRNELISTGHLFKTETDTEVIIEAYKEWGVHCLERFNGMWAFALLDLNEQTVFMARDRFGVKPVYYCVNRNGFHFASEIKALLQIADEEPRVHAKCFSDYLLFDHTDHSKYTCFENMYRLQQGEYLLYDLGDHKYNVSTFYSLPILRSMGHVSKKMFDGYSEELKELMFDSVKLRMRSDVPVGTCLSGGLDSSSLVCLMSDLMNRGSMSITLPDDNRQHVFTACYEDKCVDESIYADDVVNKTMVVAHRVYPSGERLWNELEDIIWHQDEPFGSTSIFAQWCVMGLARQNNVTVLLDGQGADEVFGGYHYYIPIMLHSYLKEGRLFQWIKQIKYLYGNNYGSSISLSESLLKQLLYLMPQYFRDVIHKNRSSIKAYVTKMTLGHYEPGSISVKHLQEQLHDSIVRTGLSALLRFEDRNSMAHSREARTPYLDYRVVEMFSNMPGGYKYYGGWTKSILRNAMRDILPQSIYRRVDKKGYATPETAWIRCHSDHIKTIFGGGLRTGRYIDERSINERFDNLLLTDAGCRIIWKLLCAELWMRRFSCLS